MYSQQYRTGTSEAFRSFHKKRSTSSAAALSRKLNKRAVVLWLPCPAILANSNFCLITGPYSESSLRSRSVMLSQKNRNTHFRANRKRPMLAEIRRLSYPRLRSHLAAQLAGVQRE